MKAVFTLASKIAPSVVFVDEVSVKGLFNICVDGFILGCLVPFPFPKSLSSAFFLIVLIRLAGK